MNKLTKPRPVHESSRMSGPEPLMQQQQQQQQEQRHALVVVKLPAANTLSRRQGGARHAASSPPRVATLAAGQVRVLDFHPMETDDGIAIHVRAAAEPVSLAQARHTQAVLRAMAPQRNALLRTGRSGTPLQAIKAIGGETLGFATVASTGFNFHNATAQLLVAQAVRARLPPQLAPPQREAICAAAALGVAPFAAGFGALLAQLLWSQLAVGAYERVVGAHRFEPQDTRVLFPPTTAFIDERGKITRSRQVVDRENERRAGQRALAAARQAGHGLDSKMGYVLVAAFFALAQGMRVAYAPLEQNPWVEGLQVALAAFLGGAMGMTILATMKCLASVEVPDTRPGRPADAVARVRLHEVVTVAPEDAGASVVSSKVSRNFRTYTGDRRGGELTRFLVSQGLTLSGIVLLASLPAPMFQAGAADAAQGASETTRRYIKGVQVACSYIASLLPILTMFPGVSTKGLRPPPPRDEEALIGLRDPTREGIDLPSWPR